MIWQLLSLLLMSNVVLERIPVVTSLFPVASGLVQPEILSERFQKQETVTLGEALFLIDQVSAPALQCGTPRQQRASCRGRHRDIHLAELRTPDAILDAILDAMLPVVTKARHVVTNSIDKRVAE